MLNTQEGMFWISHKSLQSHFTQTKQKENCYLFSFKKVYTKQDKCRFTEVHCTQHKLF